MPSGFTLSFARRLDALCAIKVKEAEHGEPLLPDVPMSRQAERRTCACSGRGGYQIALDDSSPVNRHRPRNDVLFRPLAQCGIGKRALGVILTGMGKDGALGMLEMHDRGVYTLAPRMKRAAWCTACPGRPLPPVASTRSCRRRRLPRES